jgi:ABC-type polysaccharide/polyol phosphate transport system ATPase subunit/SAM-dependent methyltransferase
VSELAIRVRDLVKDFEVYDKPLDLAIELVTRRRRHKLFRALDDVSFDVRRGEVFGIIGSNGAGKSTLLKIVTGVLDATRGRIEIAGRVTAILELGLGFNPEYSGRENIFLSGLLYGMERTEIESKVEEIIEFSGLREFIDRPVKTYSSGMHSRLAFSIATAAEPDILIIDEALAAGDAMFVQKSLRRIRQLCSGGRTVLLVSHGTSLLAQLCQRVMWLERGKIKMLGAAISVIQAYDLAAHEGADSASWIETIVDPSMTTLTGATAMAQGTTQHTFRRGPVLIDTVEMLDNAGTVTNSLTTLQPFKLRVRYHCEGEPPKPTLGVALAVNQAGDLTPAFQWFTQNILPSETRETYADARFRSRAHAQGMLDIAFPYMPLKGGAYFLSIGLLANEPGSWEFYEYRHLFYRFWVDEAGLGVGAMLLFKPVIRNEPVDSNRDITRSVGLDVAEAMAEPSRLERSKPRTLNEEIHQICFVDGGYPDRWPRHRACPCCGERNSVDAFKKNEIQHRRCVACEFVYVDPYPPDDVIQALYSGHYYTQVRELYEMDLVRNTKGHMPFSAPIGILKSIIARGTGNQDQGKWIDVGGGIGVFADLVRRERPGWSVFLNELNPRSVELARETFGLICDSRDPQQLKEEGKQFDVVSSVAVLEHIANPLEFIAGYADLLKPGGQFIAVVPQFTRLNSYVSQASSPNVVPPFHLSLFNKQNLRILMERIDIFRQIEIEDAGDPAFSLLHHVNYDDYWDVSIPTEDNKAPVGEMTKPYDTRTAEWLNSLAEANTAVSDLFAETDGRIYIIAYGRRR